MRLKRLTISLFFILLFIHIQLNVSTGDDVNFAIRAKSMTFTDFNIYKYYNWSSRQLIESVLYFISVHSHGLDAFKLISYYNYS